MGLTAEKVLDSQAGSMEYNTILVADEEHRQRALVVEVHHQASRSLRGECRGEVGRDCRLADTPFEVQHGNDCRLTLLEGSERSYRSRGRPEPDSPVRPRGVLYPRSCLK